MTRPDATRDGLARVFAVPIVLALLTFVGLLAALFGGPGIYEWVSWVALTAPVLLIGFCVVRGRLG